MAELSNDRGATARLRHTRVRKVVWFSDIDSTNRYLVEAAADGAAAGLVAVADNQHAGRGRRGRSWQSPGSALLSSVLLRPSVEPGDRPAILAAGALAGAEALDRLTGLETRLKWPNDVIVGDRKIAGLLAEAVGDAVVVGFGCNLSWEHLPPELEATATAVDRAGVEPPAPEDLLVAWLERFDDLLDRLERGEVVDVIGLVADRMDTIGRTVSVDVGEAEVVGVAERLTGPGRLLVRADDGTAHELSAGDVVHLRNA